MSRLTAKPGYISCVFAFLCWIFSSTLLADSMSVGRDLISSMATAMQDLNYAGSFVHSHDGELESMRILHSSVDGVEREKLVSLNGEAREIIRTDDTVICIWPGSKTVAVSQATARTPFPEFTPEKLAKLEKLYSFNHVGVGRVAGREVEIVDLDPLDDYRYGYRLWVDAETFLMLRSAMINQAGLMIEQVVFTDVEYNPDLPESLFSPTIAGERQEWVFDRSELSSPVSTPVTEIPGLRAPVLPDGFVLKSDKVMTLPDEGVVRRLMYTDGLASVSVYIAPSEGDTQNELQGVSAMGAVHAYGLMRNRWHATVVGEVPVDTVMMVGGSVKLTER